jgi:GT2 family glycosyltransferase
MTLGRNGATASADVPVTVVVVTWQGEHLLPDCLDSLAAQTLPHRVLVVDNASTDGTRELLADRFADVEVLALGRNTGFAGGVQAALPLVDTPFIALLNNDARAEPDWLEHSVAALAAATDVAGVTARMLLWTGAHDDLDAGRGPRLINNAGVRLTPSGYGADRGGGEPDGEFFDRPAEVFGFSGGAAVLRTGPVRSVGGMPAEFFLYYEDTDLAWRLRLGGYRIRYVPDAVVWHRHAASSDQTSELFAFYTERNRLLMLLRCAPPSLAGWQLARFLATTASLALRRRVGRPVPDVAVFRTAVRLRAAFGVLKLLPWAFVERRRIGARSRIGRHAVARDWVGESGRLS